MKKIAEFSIEDLTFLEPGAFTQPDDNARKVAAKIKRYADASNNPYPIEISNFMEKKLNYQDPEGQRTAGTMTAAELLQKRIVRSCSDRAIIFAMLNRILGGPTRYVETLEQEYLNNPDATGVVGHAFVDVQFDRKWLPYDPVQRFTPKNDYVLHGRDGKARRHIEIGKGLDFSEVYIKENGVYRKAPSNLISLEEGIRLLRK